jgi:hypothetical protein
VPITLVAIAVTSVAIMVTASALNTIAGPRDGTDRQQASTTALLISLCRKATRHFRQNYCRSRDPRRGDVVRAFHVAFMSRGVAGNPWKTLERKENVATCRS